MPNLRDIVLLVGEQAIEIRQLRGRVIELEALLAKPPDENEPDKPEDEKTNEEGR